MEGCVFSDSHVEDKGATIFLKRRDSPNNIASHPRRTESSNTSAETSNVARSLPFTSLQIHYSYNMQILEGVQSQSNRKIHGEYKRVFKMRKLLCLCSELQRTWVSNSSRGRYSAELHLSGINGTNSHPDKQKIRIIEFFSKNSLHCQFAVQLSLFTVCTCV